jgi:AhpD family alkylhydroperoxidase
MPCVERETASPELQQLYDRFRERFGTDVPNVGKTLANSPGLALKVFPLADYFMYESKLDPRVRELVVLMVMKTCSCNYAYLKHVDIARRVGVTQQQIAALPTYSDSHLFSDDDRIILQCTEELTTKVSVDDGLYRRVEAIVGRQNMVDFIGAIAFFNMMARYINALQVELES